MEDSKKSPTVSRRKFLAITSGVAASAALGGGTLLASDSKAHETGQLPKKARRLRNRGRKPNILFIFTDQERYFDRYPANLPLPGHDRMARLGTRFQNHYISSTMCTSSRSVLLTGLQTADNGMFENADMPYVRKLSFETPTFGHMLRKAGYYTAYKGKWHLNRDFETPPEGVNLNREMEKYGFSDFFSPGDSLAHELGGFEVDHMLGGAAVAWLRRKGRVLNQEGKPWSLTVSMINPHDIMYFNADAPGENEQDTGRLLMTATRAPEHAWYKQTWNQPLPSNLHQAIDQLGRPRAHAEFHRAWGYCLGHIPLKPANWNRHTDFYLNSIRAVDQQVENILAELENLGLLENTMIVFTSDHGEMGGSHGLRGKGPFAYRESLNVPMYIIHPDVEGGRECRSLTSHIDIVPSILSAAGVSQERIPEFAGRELPGSDMLSVLANPAGADLHAVRDKALFVYSGIATNDSELIRIIADAKAEGKNPKDAIRESGFKPDFMKRGSLRMVFDGRYKFTRYFAPIERHSPKDLNELFARNDVELFDLQTDPYEMNNLALNREANADLLSRMNTQLEQAIAREIGVDDGREMPEFPGVDWSIDRLDL